MGTLHGAPLPGDFTKNTVLTADDFNAVKNYWVTNELPEYDPDDPDSVEIQNGDVVFVIGDEPYDPNASGGTPGAATIESHTGATTFSILGDGTNGEDGQHYDVYKFNGAGNFVIPEDGDGVIEALIIGGGGNGGNTEANVYTRPGGGGAGAFVENEIYLQSGDYSVSVGGARAASSIGGVYTAIQGGNGGGVWGGSSSGGSGGGGAGGSHGGTGIPNNGAAAQFSELGNAGGNGTTANPGGGGGAETAGANNKAGDGKTSKIDNFATTYCRGGIPNNTANPTANTGNGGNGNTGTSGKAGASGVVIVRVAVDSPSFGLQRDAVDTRTATAARVEDGVVKQVIIVPHLDDDDNKITEYCNSIGLSGTWFDTSFNGARRGKTAEVGDLFDPNKRNAEFITPVVEEENNE